MPAAASSPAVLTAFVPRQRDRRRGARELIEAIARALQQRGDIGELRAAFETAMRQAVPACAVHVRDNGSRSALQPLIAASEAITLDVPVASGTQAAVLEAQFDPACRLGDWDFQLLSAGAHLGALVLEIERCWAQLIRAGHAALSQQKRDGAAPLIGSTPPMQALRATIEQVASTDFTVLVEGESGVGKELVARQIHELSRRRAGPFVAINCAALVETLLEAELFGIEERTATGVRGRRGKFEHADGGTLFLDEVSDLSLSAQAKLLRVIQDLAVERVGGNGAHRVDVRIIAATNRRLGDLVDRKLFRPDLFYRLSGVDVRVPTLRERRPDILELARYFLERHRGTRPLALSPAAAGALLAYEWPGNVRELERLVEGVVTLTRSATIELDDLPPAIRGDFAEAIVPSLERDETMRAWGSRYARVVLGKCGGNKRAACEALGISYHTLQAYLRYPLEADRPADARDPAVAEPCVLEEGVRAT